MVDGGESMSPDDGRTLGGRRTIRAVEILPGKLLAGRYEILEKLGSGGMGQVWKARDGELDIEVAIKVLPPDLAASESSIRALKREAAVSLRLTHRNICRLYNFRADGEIKFLVMEYIPGQTLERILEDRDSRRIPLNELLPLAEQIAEALDYAHCLNPPILHRDVKPSNIMMLIPPAEPTGTRLVKVLDFGIARELKDSMTRVTGQETSGTLVYMSPEQYAGKAPTPAGDVYSFAATLYECLSGRPPFFRGAISHQILNMEPSPIEGMPEHVNRALLAGLAKAPADRPASTKGLLEVMQAPQMEAPSESPEQAAPAELRQTDVVLVSDRAEERHRPSPPDLPRSASLGAESKRGRRRVFAAAGMAVVFVALAVPLLLHVPRSSGPPSVGSGGPAAEPGSPDGDSVPLAPEVPVTRSEVLPLRIQAGDWLSKLEEFDIGQTIGHRIQSALDELQKSEQSFQDEQYGEARDHLEAGLSEFREIQALDALRPKVEEARQGYLAASEAAKAQKADELARDTWVAALEKNKEAQNHFEFGGFEKAIQEWSEATDLCRKAVAEARFKTSRDAFEQALAETRPELRQRFVGEEGAHLREIVDAAEEAAGREGFDRGQSLYEQGRLELRQSSEAYQHAQVARKAYEQTLTRVQPLEVEESDLEAWRFAQAHAKEAQAKLEAGEYGAAQEQWQQATAALSESAARLHRTAARGILDDWSTISSASSSAQIQSIQEGLANLKEARALAPGLEELGKDEKQLCQKLEAAAFLAEAEAFERKRDWIIALQALKKVLELDPANTNASRRFGTIEPVLSYDQWPFDGSEAKRRQQETAKALALAPSLTLPLGNGIEMDLVVIPSGQFQMGSPAEESGRDDDETQHRVTITRPFYMGIHEVTQEQYEAMMGNNPSNFKGAKDPVEQVLHDNAVAFCRELSQQTGKTVRLPTEAEWEYACRAGTTSRFSFGDSDSSLSDHAWYSGNSGRQTHPVGGKKPNAWGLYDMHGNVLEWCSDWSGEYPGGNSIDPKGPNNGTYRVLRGGSWFNFPQNCRSAGRFRGTPDYTSYSLGFRVVVSLD
jgi:formylglycine-generating enzyme required for sulfatase activity/serine/threonine protein kinase